MDRPVIVEHTFGHLNAGGIVGTAQTVMQSGLSEQYDFRELRQTRPLGGVNLAAISGLSAHLRSVAPDLIHVRGLGNEGFHAVMASRWARVPRILVSIHGSHRDLATVAGTAKVRSKAVGNYLEPATLAAADYIATVCRAASRNPLVRRNSDKFIGVVPNGVAAPTFTRDEAWSFRAEERISDDAVVFTFVGRLTSEKGLGDLLTAVRILRALETPGLERAVFVLVGDGHLHGQLRELAPNGLGVELRVLGRRTDVSRILAASDVFVFPSLHENLSLALLEAMAHGLACVATSVGGNVELIDNSASGILVPPSSPEALAAALSSLLARPSDRSAMGKAATLRIENEFTSDHMVASWGRVYGTLLSREASR